MSNFIFVYNVKWDRKERKITEIKDTSREN